MPLKLAKANPKVNERNVVEWGFKQVRRQKDFLVGGKASFEGRTCPGMEPDPTDIRYVLEWYGFYPPETFWSLRYSSQCDWIADEVLRTWRATQPRTHEARRYFHSVSQLRSRSSRVVLMSDMDSLPRLLAEWDRHKASIDAHYYRSEFPYHKIHR